MPEWTFLTNHALVLSLIARKTRITARDLSLAIGITERAVRKTIADLDAAGYISKKREGRRIQYRINPNLSLRHETHGDVSIADFLEALGWKSRRKQRPTSKTGQTPADKISSLPSP